MTVRPILFAMEDHEHDMSAADAVASIDALLESVQAPVTSKHEGRLIIQKMVLENFKSHGGLKEIGPFHTSMSAVVGPNGSGKSNVIDAFLFVLGKRATKLRLKKLSELIHKSRYDRNRCDSWSRMRAPCGCHCPCLDEIS